jgi:hypothetical protein
MLGNPIDASGGKPPKIKVRTSAEDNSNINRDFSKDSVMKSWGVIKKGKAYKSFLESGPDTWQEGDVYMTSPTELRKQIRNQILDDSNPRDYAYNPDRAITRDLKVADYVAANVLKYYNAETRQMRKEGDSWAFFGGQGYYAARKKVIAAKAKKGKKGK